MRPVLKNTALLAILIFTLYACSVKKYVPEGEYLYRGGDISLKTETRLSQKSDILTTLENVLYPEPNSKALGMYVGLYFHYKAQQEHPGFINRFFNKKIGEDPVYLSEVNIENTVDLLQNRLKNNGFFYGDVTHRLKKDTAGKTAKIKYTITIDTPYRIAEYKVDVNQSTDTLPIYEDLRKSIAETALEEGKRFNLQTLKKERQRIDQYLKEQGYYYFNENFILFQVDTNVYDNHRFNLYVKLKKGIPQKAKVPYVLDSVEVYTNVDVVNDTVYGVQDTVRVENVDIIQGEMFFKPKRLRPFILLEPGQYYSPENSSYTSRRLSSIGTYKFVNIYYKTIDSTITNGVGHLKSVITLSPRTKNAFQFKLQGVTKSNGFTGPGLSLSYTNRNIFKGGERFKIQGIVGYEKQLFNKGRSSASSLHLGLQASLLFPRMLLLPGSFEKVFRYAIPKTEISVGTDFLNRTDLYALNSFSASFGYIWHQNRFVTHRLHPVQIDYVNLMHTTAQFEQVLNNNPFLRRSFEQQFISGLTYSFTYNELNKTPNRGQLYFQFNFDIAGNLISLFGQPQPNGAETFLGLKYAQYAKGDINVSYHYHLGHSRKSTLVAHLFAGLGLPYGNSKSLPFVKQYFTGGPYSVRAFPIRSLGPGTYQPAPGKEAYFDRAGDIRLEANLEYRFPIISFLKGALFVDAGNVWLKNENPALPGGAFSSNFINELGIGTGVGLRVDIQGFVLRFDLAAPLKRPANPWDFEYKNPVFNFAIGYPF